MLTLNLTTPDVIKAATLIADAIDGLTLQLKFMEKTMNEAIQKLTEQVAATTAVEASAVTLIAGIVQQLKDAATDPQKVLDLANALQAGTQPLADAVAANTIANP